MTNAIPGMVLGVAYLFLFSGSGLQNTLLLMILCNIVHYFSTPYLMMKNSLSKMNAGWETTAMLMGDSWLKTIVRVVTPNAMSTVMEVFSYYFVNAMVTISARHLHRGSAHHGHHDENQGTAVLQQIQRDICAVALHPAHQLRGEVRVWPAGGAKQRKNKRRK